MDPTASEEVNGAAEISYLEPCDANSCTQQTLAPLTQITDWEKHEQKLESFANLRT